METVTPSENVRRIGTQLEDFAVVVANVTPTKITDPTVRALILDAVEWDHVSMTVVLTARYQETLIAITADRCIVIIERDRRTVRRRMEWDVAIEIEVDSDTSVIGDRHLMRIAIIGRGSIGRGWNGNALIESV